MLQTRLCMSVYETFILDIVAPEVHQNNRSHVFELSRPTFDPLCRNLAWWGVHGGTKKTTQNCQNWGIGICSGQYSKFSSITLIYY